MNHKKLVRIVGIACIPITLASALMLLLCFKTSFDANEGYFTSGALPIVFQVLYVLGILLAIASTIALNRKQVIKSPNQIGIIKIPFLLIAVMLTACAIAFTIVLAEADTFLSILGICSFAAYIVLCVVLDGYDTNAIKILLVYLGAAFPVSMIMYNTSITTRHINSIENTLSVAFGLSFMAYILYEAKRIYEGAHSRWHFGAMLLTVHTGFTLSFAYVVAYLSGSVYEKPRFLQMITSLLITVLVGIELFRFVNESKALTQAEWDELEDTDEESEQTENKVEKTTNE